DQFLENFRIKMTERREYAERTSIAEKGVEPAPAVEDRLAETVERLEIAQAQRYQGRAAASLFHGIIGFLEPTDRARNENDMGTGTSEANRRRAADATRCAGYERDFILERFGHRCHLFPELSWPANAGHPV